MENSFHVGMSATLQLMEICGIVAFACSGFIEARSKQMDMVGVFVVAFVASFGGGTLRDLLMGRHPLFWIQHQEYPLLVFLLTLAITPFFRHLRTSWAEKSIVFADALGLGIFSAVGTSLAQEAQIPVFVCAMMGVITAVFGGVLRDVLCNEIPMVFRRNQLYTACSFFGCWIFLLLKWLHLPQVIALVASATVIVIVRLLAVRFDIRMPSW